MALASAKTMRRLLFLNCSARKRASPEALAALDRYDGPTFRTVRRYLKKTRDSELRLLVLSARYGFISGDERIPNYDETLTAERVKAICCSLVVPVHACLAEFQPTAIASCLSSGYARAASSALAAAGEAARVSVFSGPPGVVSARLHDWLWGSAPHLNMRRARGAGVQFCGRTLDLSRAEVRELVKQAFNSNPRGSRPTTWAVEIDGLSLSPKWVMHVVADVPLSEFATGAARGALATMGWETRRVESSSADAE